MYLFLAELATLIKQRIMCLVQLDFFLISFWHGWVWCVPDIPKIPLCIRMIGSRGQAFHYRYFPETLSCLSTWRGLCYWNLIGWYSWTLWRWILEFGDVMQSRGLVFWDGSLFYDFAEMSWVILIINPFITCPMQKRLAALSAAAAMPMSPWRCKRASLAVCSPHTGDLFFTQSQCFPAPLHCLNPIGFSLTGIICTCYYIGKANGHCTESIQQVWERFN